MKIQDSVCFVSGANRGIGLEFARALLLRGAARVYAGMRETSHFSELGVVPVALDLHDMESVMAAADRCGDVNLLINNAGVAYVAQSVLDPAILSDARAMFETNYFGTMRVTQAFAPALLRNAPGAILNVLSIASWIAGPALAAYSASKSAEWSFTNALRIELADTRVEVSALHMGFVDTDLTRGMEVVKLSPQDVVRIALDGLEQGMAEIIADEGTRAVKHSLGSPGAAYLNPPPIH
ncbi:SDR family oxidoreductase [Massilia niastensis]|uniref:SDR family oxidoreductase n=1 Tax=Massilia niastensis TaxID=544911 RepID=UPI00037105E8|nr:SDR family oxidoreductase [Massilia niastensis]